MLYQLSYASGPRRQKPDVLRHLNLPPRVGNKNKRLTHLEAGVQTALPASRIGAVL